MSAPRQHRGKSALALVVAAVLIGCDDGRPGVVRVATAWPAAEREAVERLLADVPGAPTLRWILLAPGDDVARLALRRSPPDLLLGGPASTYQRLDASDDFEPIEAGRGWQPLRSFDGPGASVVEVSQGGFPRHTAGARLTWSPWPQGYADLVRQVAAWPAPTRVVDEPSAVVVEGAAIPRGASNVDAARLVLDVLRRQREASWPARPVRPEVESLLADLIGATMFEARDELREAWVSLDRAGFPPRPTTWMTTPPPWPPASVAQIADDMPLLETLAAQLAPEADTRAWLLRSWVAPSRSVDGPLLEEIAGAAEGRLVREPRFRAWLRAEWTAWARQRYRRVARLTEWGGAPG